MECPVESTACLKLRVDVEKSKVLSLIEEYIHLVPSSQKRKRIDFYRLKADLLWMPLVPRYKGN